MAEAIKVFMGLFILSAMIADFVSSRRARRNEDKHEVKPEVVFDLDMMEMCIVAERTAIQCGVKDPCLIVGREAYRKMQCSSQFLQPMCRINGRPLDSMVPRFLGMHVFLEESVDLDAVYARSECDYIAEKQIQRQEGGRDHAQRGTPCL